MTTPPSDFPVQNSSDAHLNDYPQQANNQTPQSTSTSPHQANTQAYLSSYNPSAPYTSIKKQSSEPNFFKALFDFSFSHFITVKFAKVLYVLSMVFAALFILGIFFTMISESGFIYGFLGLMILVPIGIFGVICARLYLEVAVALIRVAENSSHIREILRSK